MHVPEYMYIVSDIVILKLAHPTGLCQGVFSPAHIKLNCNQISLLILQLHMWIFNLHLNLVVVFYLIPYALPKDCT